MFAAQMSVILLILAAFYAAVAFFGVPGDVFDYLIPVIVAYVALLVIIKIFRKRKGRHASTPPDP